MKTVLRIVAACAISTGALPSAVRADDQTHMIEPIPAASFMKLTGDLQAAYVAGIMEGMAYVQYNYSMKDYPLWAACIRKSSLGETTQDVVKFLQDHPAEESVSFALSQTLGPKCKH